jgi:hypothetical protein
MLMSVAVCGASLTMLLCAFPVALQRKYMFIEIVSVGRSCKKSLSRDSQAPIPDARSSLIIKFFSLTIVIDL